MPFYLKHEWWWYKPIHKETYGVTTFSVGNDCGQYTVEIFTHVKTETPYLYYHCLNRISEV